MSDALKARQNHNWSYFWIKYVVASSAYVSDLTKRLEIPSKNLRDFYCFLTDDGGEGA